jgi:hypothetical protein
MDRLLFASEACRIAEVAHMYPACLVGSRAVALMGNTHAPLISLADRLPGNHLGQQIPGAFIDPFHASLSRELGR